MILPTEVPVSFLILKMDNLPTNLDCPKAKSGWIWQADNL